MAVTKDDLRRYAVARSLFAPTTLKRAVHKLGFVQADPIRAPARAQDLTLRHRVPELPRRRSRAALCAARRRGRRLRQLRLRRREVQALMHPRGGPTPWPRSRARRVGGAAGLRPRARRGASARGGRALLARDGHELLGRIVERHYAPAGRHALPRPAARGAARGGHPRLRRARPRAGPLDARRRDYAQLDALVDVVVRKYAPLPGATLSWLVNRLRYARAAVAARAEAGAGPRARSGSRTRESTASTGTGRPTIA